MIGIVVIHRFFIARDNSREDTYIYLGIDPIRCDTICSKRKRFIHIHTDVHVPICRSRLQIDGTLHTPFVCRGTLLSLSFMELEAGEHRPNSVDATVPEDSFNF